MRRALAVPVLAALLLSPVPGGAQEPPGPCGRPEERAPGVPVNVELTTVTEGTFAVSWLTCDAAGAPLPSDTTVAYGTSPNPATWERVTAEDQVAFHYAEIAGLEEGTVYHYQVFSAGLPGPYGRYHPGSFTTLRPPPGRPLLSIAVLADPHIGETVSGLATSSPFEFPPSFRSDERYPEIMARAAVAEINALRPHVTILPADQTSHGRRSEMRRLRDILGDLRHRYLIARGAHDRPNQYAAARDECPPDGDCFRHVFFPQRRASEAPRDVYRARVVRGFQLVALDSANLVSGTGELPEEQLAWLERRLEEGDERGFPSIIFFHHPVSEWSTTLAVPPLVFGVNQQDAGAFLRLVGRHDVRAVINAHTHRNWISYSPLTGRMPILEVGPAKEYPGGYSLIRVYEDGFVRTWHRLSCDFCRRWIETTRWQYLGQYPHYTTGSLRDRNFVHRWDGPDVPGIPSLPFNPWPPLVPMEG